MSSQTLSKGTGFLPSVFNDFLPWNEWFNGDGIFEKRTIYPAVNITEEKDQYRISLAVPGMDKKDFSIETSGDMITISAEKEESKEEKEKKFTRKEYNYSSFSRSFTLPENIEKDKIDANYKDGVLEISLPKNEKTKSDKSKKVVVK